MVTVSSATPQPPTAFPLMQCDAATADTITVGCLATGFTPSSLTYAWRKNGVALTDFIQYPPVQKNNLYTGVSQIRVRRQDWDSIKTLQCAVTHPAGNAEVGVYGGPHTPEEDVIKPSLKVLASSDEENEASFSCFAKDFSPNTYEFKWLKNDKDIANKKYELTTPAKETKYENGTVVYSAASLLVVPSSEWTSGTTFTCQFKGEGETVTNSSVTHDKPPCGGCKTADVDITILGPRMEDIFKDSLGQIVCQVNVSKPSVSRIWWENEFGKELVSSPQDAIKITTGVFNLSLEITYEEWSQGVKRYCFVEHTEWVEPTKRPFERNAVTFVSPTLEVLASSDEKNKASLSCFAKDFSPNCFAIKWLKNGKDITNKIYEIETFKKRENETGTVLYSAASFLTVHSDEWSPGTTFTCQFEGKDEKNYTILTSSVTYKETVSVCLSVTLLIHKLIFGTNMSSKFETIAHEYNEPILLMTTLLK
uniref:Ig mu chain C region isoform X2 n=1 Tax=Scatophagus argus TaxID=75038 RepID=UPI001ED85D73|nr:Ig mu chain C region isoform X2 [Scatophagus argus]